MDPKKLEFVQFSEISVNQYLDKEQCVMCFRTPQHAGGLYICLSTHLAVCPVHLQLYVEISGNHGFLSYYQQAFRKKNERTAQDYANKEMKEVYTDGFFDPEYFIVIYPNLEEKFPLDLAPAPLRNHCEELVLRDSRLPAAENINVWCEERFQTHHKELFQLPNPPQIPPTGWRCQAEECGVNENLWLNLSDGTIFCGRRQMLATGKMSVGNEHALQHYQKTGNIFPLVVKLATITPQGADVYSYDEDSMVLDPNLNTRLAHFGIRMQEMTKTEKSIDELEEELQNISYETALIEGKNETPIHGPNLTGLVNLGNSCYINSSVQLLNSIPAFSERFRDQDTLYAQFGGLLAEAQKDLGFQIGKLLASMHSGDYSQPSPAEINFVEGENTPVPAVNKIRPTLFRYLIGKDHVEFSTKKQQDAEEFLTYLIEKVEAITSTSDLTNCLAFTVEDHLEVRESTGAVRREFRKCQELFLSLHIDLTQAKKPEEPAANEEGKTPRPKILMVDCIQRYFVKHSIEDYRDENTGVPLEANSQRYMTTFPDFLLIQAKRFDLDKNWQPIKKQLDLIVPDTLDLSTFKGIGLQTGELEVGKQPESAVGPDEDTLAMLMSMGFSRSQCVFAVQATGNAGPEAAANFLFENVTGDTMQGAEEPATGSADTTNGPNLSDGCPKYELQGFITHTGPNVGSGHYYCHLKKDQGWVCFNDEVVTLCASPPKELAYIYLYKRVG